MDYLDMEDMQSSKREDEFIRAYNALCAEVEGREDDSSEHYWHGKENGMTAEEFFKINSEGAELKIPSALCDMGYCYEFGIGVEQDDIKALEYYKKSAECGDAAGMQSLGWCCAKGIGTKADAKKAFECFENSANHGDGVAMNNLGDCYLNGFGTTANKKTAFDLYVKSAYFGYIGAVKNIRYCLENGVGTDKDKESAKELLKIGSKDHAQDAMKVLKKLYEDHGIM